MATTYYIPSSSGWTSGNYKMRLEVVQSYNSSTNKSTLTITPQFYGSAGGTFTLVSGYVKYSVGSSTTKTTLWDFSQKTSGNNYPFAAPFDASWKNMTRQVVDTSWQTSKEITVTHNGDGNISVTFYAESVQTTIGSSPSFSGNKAQTFTGTARTYTLTISAGTGSSITVKRSGTTLSNGATITYGDVLTITFAASTGYNLATHTVNGSTFTSGGTHTVTGAVTVASTATKKSYTLTITKDANSVVTVKRGSTTLSNGATIYYGDSLTVTASASSGYQVKTFTINGTTKTSPATVSVSGNVAVDVTTEAQGLAYIRQSSAWVPYEIYIYTSGAFARYRAYIYTNGAWTPF